MKFDRKIRHRTVQYIVLSCVIWMSTYVSGFSIQSTPHVQAQTQNTFRNPSWIDFSRSRGYTVSHTAVDFQTHFDPIAAVADGTVRTVAETSSETLAWCLANGGTQVKNPKRHFEIDHSMYRSGYTHLSSFGVNPRTGLQWQVGDKIFAGELVGNSGDSGCTAGAHLHFTTWTSAGALTNPDSPQLWAPFYPSDGYIETPVNNTTVQGMLRISGWTKVDKAFDVATSIYQPSTGGAIDRVEIWLLDPNGVNPNPRKLGDAIYGTARPDAGGNYGWYFDWDSATVPNGTYLIQPRAVARNGMTSVLKGGVSGSVTVNTRIPESTVIDSPVDGVTIQDDMFTIRGWAIYPPAASGTGVTNVHVWLDAPSPPNGQFLGGATYGIERPDVASLYGETYRYSGFELTWDTHALSPGPHTLYIAARHPDASWSANQIRTVTIQHPTRIVAELPVENATLQQGTTTIQGWAIYQTANLDTGVTNIHVWLDAPSPNGQFLGGATYGIERPDVASLYGETYRYSGFELTWDTLAVSPGTHTLYIAARHPDASWSADLIRTVTIQVPTPVTPSPTPVTPSPTPVTPSPTPVTPRHSVYLPMIRR